MGFGSGRLGLESQSHHQLTYLHLFAFFLNKGMVSSLEDGH